MSERKYARSLEFGRSLGRWRRFNQIKQSALAERLGVSQSAVARWESGRDQPSRQHFHQLRDMMAETMIRETAIDCAFLARQTAVRALVCYDDLSMLAVSDGFRLLWPEFSAMTGVTLLDSAVNESALIRFDPAIRQEVESGRLGILSGVSNRHIDLPFDEGVLHRWHMCFRQRGGRLLVDIVFEPCQTATTGIQEFVHLDALDSVHDL